MKSHLIFSSLLQRFLRQSLAIFLTACMALILVACGGGASLSSGVGSGGSGIAEGAVTGFGSVIIDGVTYEDTNASVAQANADGGTDLAQAKLGQRARVTHSQAGVADQIMLLPQLRGTASSAADTNGWFQLLGQWVQIVSTTGTQSTATVLDGLTSVAVGDALEVHGTWTFDSGKNVSVLIASRIEKLSASPDPVLISGVVRARSGTSVTLDNASGTLLQNSNMPSSIAPQRLVTAWVAQSAMIGSSWVAKRIIDASPQPSDTERLVLGTTISTRDLQNGSVMVQGLSVKLPSNLQSNPPAAGTPVQMDIVREGNGWKAVIVTERQSKNDLGGVVSLKGSLVWPASGSTLILRGVTVSTTPSVLSNSCTTVPTGSTVYLEIVAQRSQPGQPLQASQVTCSLQTPSHAVIEQSGVLTRITPDASGLTGTLLVTTNQGSQSFAWTALTLLPRNLSSWLNSKVEVEYQVINGENRLRQVKPD